MQFKHLEELVTHCVHCKEQFTSLNVFTEAGARET